MNLKKLKNINLIKNKLYFFTSIFILIIMFAVVIYFTKQPITAGKAWSVIYKGEEGTFPLTITFTKDESGVLTKEAPFLDGLNKFTLSIGDIAYGKIQALTIAPQIEEVGNVCGDGVCGEGENCPADCPLPSVCNDGVCDQGEDVHTCPEDCKVISCGDNICGIGETLSSCPIDCPQSCFSDSDCNDQSFKSCHPILKKCVLCNPNALDKSKECSIIKDGSQVGFALCAQDNTCVPCDDTYTCPEDYYCNLVAKELLPESAPTDMNLCLSLQTISCDNDGVCEIGEATKGCPEDCTPPDLIVEKVKYVSEESNQYKYMITFKNNGQTDIFVPSTESSDLYFRIMTYLYDDNKVQTDEYENWLNMNLNEGFKMNGESTLTIFAYFDKTNILTPDVAHLKVVVDVNDVVAESDETNNFFWFNPIIPPQQASNNPFEPPEDNSWGYWQEGEYEVTFSKVDYESELSNEYLNNPFISGYIIYISLDQQSQMSLKDIQIVAISNTIKEYYYETQSNKILFKTYTCPKDRYLLSYTANINGVDSILNTYACYCTINAQCGYGWTCDLTQGDGDATKGKCLKNP